MKLFKLVLPVLLLLSTSVYAKSLVFMPKVYVTDVKSISLADIVDKSKMGASDISKLQKVRISNMPEENKSVTLSSVLVSEALRRNVKDDFTAVRIPSSIEVYNQKAELNKSVVYDRLLWHWQQLCDNCRVEIKNLILPTIPKELEKKDWALQPQDRLPKGSFSEKLIVHDTKGREITYWVRGELKIYKRVPVATRTLFMNSKLKSDDFKWEWRDITFANDGVPTESGLQNMQLRQGIAANQIIWAGSIALEKTVRRGEIVQVKSGGEDWQVSMQAVTEQDGYVGDVISVRNIQTKKIITGEVVGPGEILAR